MTPDLARMLAAYNRWANARLYAAALALPDEAYRRPLGVFFGSLHGTLNHLLLTDRLWLKRLTGQGEHPDRLDAVLYQDRAELARARLAEDARLEAVVGGYDAAALARRSRAAWPRCCCTCSTTRRITAARRMPAARSSPAPSRRRSTCCSSGAAPPRPTSPRWSDP